MIVFRSYAEMDQFEKNDFLNLQQKKQQHSESPGNLNP